MHGKRKADRRYKDDLKALQIELVKLQRHLIAGDMRLLVLFEGRDAAGKDGVIKRIVEHLSPRDVRVVAMGKPSQREQGAWYFQRYTTQLPSAGEWVLFNRSWYNRAGVERVMDFCSDAEYQAFMKSVLPFEHMLMDAGLTIVKYYLDISKGEQRRRLEARAKDPLSQWKISPIDQSAQRHWNDYSDARDLMLRKTHDQRSPWIVVKADDKKVARLNIIRDILWRVRYPDRDRKLERPDPNILFSYSSSHRRRLAH